MHSKGNIHTFQKSRAGEHRGFKERGWLLRDVGTGICLEAVGGRECSGSWSREENNRGMFHGIRECQIQFLTGTGECRSTLDVLKFRPSLL